MHPGLVNYCSKEEMMKNQTLVDWLIVSAGSHFEPDWDSENEMII